MNTELDDLSSIAMALHDEIEKIMVECGFVGIDTTWAVITIIKAAKTSQWGYYTSEERDRTITLTVGNKHVAIQHIICKSLRKRKVVTEHVPLADPNLVEKVIVVLKRCAKNPVV